MLSVSDCNSPSQLRFNGWHYSRAFKELRCFNDVVIGDQAATAIVILRRYITSRLIGLHPELSLHPPVAQPAMGGRKGESKGGHTSKGDKGKGKGNGRGKQWRRKGREVIFGEVVV